MNNENNNRGMFSNPGISVRMKLSALWIFVMFNYLYCDVMSLMDQNLLNQLLTGKVGPMEVTEGFLLGAAFLMEIPIAMVLLSLILSYRINRWANIGAGTLKTLVMIATMFIGKPSLHYLFFGIIEITCTSFIVWYAWRWREGERSDKTVF